MEPSMTSPPPADPEVVPTKARSRRTPSRQHALVLCADGSVMSFHMTKKRPHGSAAADKHTLRWWRHGLEETHDGEWSHTVRAVADLLCVRRVATWQERDKLWKTADYYNVHPAIALAMAPYRPYFSITVPPEGFNSVEAVARSPNVFAPDYYYGQLQRENGWVEYKRYMRRIRTDTGDFIINLEGNKLFGFMDFLMPRILEVKQVVLGNHSATGCKWYNAISIWVDCIEYYAYDSDTKQLRFGSRDSEMRMSIPEVVHTLIERGRPIKFAGEERTTIVHERVSVERIAQPLRAHVEQHGLFVYCDANAQSDGCPANVHADGVYGALGIIAADITDAVKLPLFEFDAKQCVYG